MELPFHVLHVFFLQGYFHVKEDQITASLLTEGRRTQHILALWIHEGFSFCDL